MFLTPSVDSNVPLVPIILEENSRVSSPQWWFTFPFQRLYSLSPLSYLKSLEALFKNAATSILVSQKRFFSKTFTNQWLLGVSSSLLMLPFCCWHPRPYSHRQSHQCPRPFPRKREEEALVFSCIDSLFYFRYDFRFMVPLLRDIWKTRVFKHFLQSYTFCESLMFLHETFNFSFMRNRVFRSSPSTVNKSSYIKWLDMVQ